MGFLGDVIGFVGDIVGLGGAEESSDQQQQGISEAQATQNQATADAVAAQNAQYAQMLEMQKPWMETGGRALGTLEQKVNAGPGEYEKSPGYDFRFNQGVQAIDRSAASKGMLESGATMKALTEYGQDYATNDYNNFLQRYYASLTPYQSLAGLGQTSTNLTSQGSMNYGTNLSNIYQNQGNNLATLQMLAGQSRAAGTANQTGGYMNLIGSGGNLLGNFMGNGSGGGSSLSSFGRMFGSLFGGGGSSGGSSMSSFGSGVGDVFGSWGSA